ncbi:MAG: phosphate acyltransferase PlsX [Candidatus Nitrospinota bacterium M3_3B_026]
MSEIEEGGESATPESEEETAPAPQAPGKDEITVALDAMGGDNAPEAIIDGAIQAVENGGDVRVILVGDEERVDGLLSKRSYDKDRLSVRHAEEAVGMDESPSAALRKKKKSSIHTGVKMVKEGEADAFISAGNTGAVMAVATVFLNTLEGIDRAAIAVTLPTRTGHTVLLDAGANVVCKAGHLYEFGLMGAIYAQYVLDDHLPRVGLLSIGEEETKGNDVIRDAFELLTESSINFVGNVEAKLLYRGVADVVVCDGFTGNIALKISESVAEMISVSLKEMFKSSLRGRMGYLLLRPGLEEFKKRIDHSEVGGAPLLGIDGAVFISHGSSGPKSIKSAVMAAKKFVREDVNGHIRESLQSNQDILRSKAGKRGGLWDQMKRKIGLSGYEEPETK